jgi:fibronectin type 3 domain-containing protein
MIMLFKHLYLVILLLVTLLMSSCNNPLDTTGSDKSSIDSSFSLFLEPPGSFVFTHSSVVSGQVEFSFGASARAESYVVKYGLSSGSYPITSSCTSSPCTISGLTNGTNYFITVVATNAKGSRSIAGELVLSPADAPTTPSGLSATVSSGNVALSWSASTGTGTITYSVYRSTSSGSGFSLLASGLSSSSYSDSSVTNGTTYYYEVTATNSNGMSGYSSELSKMPMDVPSGPTSLVATSSSGSVSLSWQAASGLGSITYNIYRSTTSGSGYTSIASNLSAISYTDSSVTNGTSYFYIVKASNAAGLGSSSSEVAITPLSAPTGLSASGTTSQLSLSWASVTGATSYNVYRSTVSGNYVAVTPFSSTTNGYVDSTVTNGLAYYYVVTAVKGTSESSISSEVTSKPVAAPTGFAAQSGASQVVLSWGSTTGASSYSLYRSTTSGSYSSALATGLTGTTYTDSTAVAGTTYFYTIKADSTNSTSVESSEVSALPLSSFSISSVAVNGSNALQISWGSSTGASSYTIKYGTASGSYTTTLTNQTSPLTISSLTAGTTYYFLVVANNTSGSLNANAETIGIPLGSFSLTSLLPQTGATSVVWGTSTGSTSYDVLYGTTSGTYSTTLTGKTTPAVVSSLTAGTIYYFKVRANNAYGSITSTNELSGNVYQNFSLDIPFDVGTTSGYNFSDSTISDFTSGSFRLTPSDQVDDDSSASGFGGGTHNGTMYDSTNTVLRLNSTTNIAELDSSWTPQYSSLALYWKMNGTGYISNTSFAPEVGSSTCLATSASTISYSTGKLQTAIGVTSGNSTYCTGTNITSISNNITIVGWVKHTGGTASAYASIIDSFNWSSTPTTGWTIQRGNTNNYFYIRVDTSASTNVVCAPATTDQNLLDGYWHHYAFTIGAGSIKVFIDGKLSNSCSYSVGSGFASNNANLLIKGFSSDATTYHDDLAIFNSILSTSEIQKIFYRQVASYSGTFLSRVMDSLNTSNAFTNLSFTSTLPFSKQLPATSETSSSYSSISSNLMSNLIALWHFDETSGTSIADSSGNYYSATTINSPTLGTATNLGTGIKFTKANSQYLTVPSINLGNVFSVSVWANVGYSTTEWLTLLSNCNTGSNSNGFKIAINSWTTANGSVIIETGNGTASASTITTTGLANPNYWHHYVFTIDRANGSASIYVDGVLKVTSAVKTDFLNSGALYIGAAKNPSAYFDGILDEMAIWSRSLSLSEIQQLYRRGANRLKYQIRTCANSDCSDQEALTTSYRGWKGPDNTGLTYFSELYNTTLNSSTGNVQTTSPLMTFSNFSSVGLSVAINRYVQYRTILESDDTKTLCTYNGGSTYVACSPEIKTVTVGPTHYSTTNPYITSKASIGSLYQSLGSFTVTQGSNGCLGDKYTVSGDGSVFWYFNGATWVQSNGSYTQSSTASQINSNIGTLVSLMGVGTIQIRTHLNSDGVTACEVSNLNISGQKY